ncbi:hypothetical protein JMG10_19375 [Nostoc ellipsosporum NOK]|nr:hypothetical protein [Nostoc ellipsosporum NOK]
MKLNKKIILLAGGLLAGVAAGYLFTSSPTSSVKKIIDLRKVAERNETAINNRIVAVRREEKQVTGELAASKKKLAQVVARKEPLYKLLNEVTVSKVTDTFISVVRESDSLFHQVIEQQDTLLAIKDTLIAFHQLAYASLRTSFDQSLQQQEAILQVNKQLTKDLKGQRRKTRLIAAAAVLVTGLTTGYLLSR